MSSRGTRYWNSGAIPLIAPDVLGNIISSASDLAVVITDEGQILSVLINPDHRSFGRLEHWEGGNVRDFLTIESVEKLDRRLEAFHASQPTGPSIELNHTDNSIEFPIRYTFHRIGPDGAVLMLGRDLRPIAEMQQQLVKAQAALERDYEMQREFDTRFRVLMETTSEPIIFVAMSSGRITDINKAAANLLGGTRGDLVGSAIAQEFDGRRRGEFMESLTNIAVSDTKIPLQLQARRSKRQLKVLPTAFRAAGERLLLCRLDLAEEGAVVADEMSMHLLGFYEHGADAIVFTNASGTILSANDSFLNMLDAANVASVKGKPLGDFLARGAVDSKVLIENASRTGQMRMYATKLIGTYDSQTSVEISATYLEDQAHPAFAFSIRDASRVEAVRVPGVGVSDDAVRSVMELVGSAALKDIVAETTDVVEKMCIETAVELTSNNRVAAAEMLGLSRQSLYVKLRKYGLLVKDPDA
ncbi:transcriptional regulator PpsR [Algirhabdus cladophorae]|uniref:transcriptional regulator PpsR n=1 Tax=Algirhabdus cladophorae TaxID=3377108 RepID=UPI003B8498CE